MANGRISTDRILSRLDEYLGRNDYTSAEKHLLYWLSEAEAARDGRAELLVRNELMGLFRKLGREADAIGAAEAAMQTVDALKLSQDVGAATTYLNSATVFKAFGMADRAIGIFEKAKEIYERELEPTDARLAGLYNNMALALVDLGRFREANALYCQAIGIVTPTENGALEAAITYLNMASAAEAELGLEDAAERVGELVDTAQELLERHPKRDGYYAFVCEKCATVFDYYGYFYFANELKERARRIYEGA